MKTITHTRRKFISIIWFSRPWNQFSEYFSISSMNMQQHILIQRHILLVVDHDIWKLLQNLKIIDGAILENYTGGILNILPISLLIGSRIGIFLLAKCIGKILKTLWRGRMGHGAVIVGDKTFVIGGKTENNQWVSIWQRKTSFLQKKFPLNFKSSRNRSLGSCWEKYEFDQSKSERLW